jgi:hypothetical protein
VPLPDSGIRYDPALDEVFASRWAGYRWHEWRRLSGDMKSMLVAAYDLHCRIAAVQEKAAADATRK